MPMSCHILADCGVQRGGGDMPIVFDLVGQQWQRKIIVLAIALAGSSCDDAAGLNAGRRVLARDDRAKWSNVHRDWHDRTHLVFPVYRRPQALQTCHRRSLFGDAQSALPVFRDCRLRRRRTARKRGLRYTLRGRDSRDLFLVIRHEERALTELFPGEYALYQTRVPRLIPAFCRWQDVEAIEVRPALVHQTFRDAMLFMLAVPELKALESLRDLWLTAPVFRLY